MKPSNPLRAYRILLRRFGPQGWWPVAPRRGSRPEYHPGRFRVSTEQEAVEIAVGAILTQNTTWGNVERAVESIHRARAMDAASLSRMPAARLQNLIRPSGYFRQKAGRLKVFLNRVRERGGLKGWLKQNMGGVRGELLSLSGIGPETADSILLYAGARPAFVVDAYTLRIGERLGWFKHASYHQAQEFFARSLPRSAAVYQEFHALLVALAKLFCRKQPLCLACPLRPDCRYGRSRRLPMMAVSILLGLLHLAALSQGAAAALYAAAGKIDITPDAAHHTVWLAGYGPVGRKAKGVHDPLFARALVVSDGKRTVALVGIDSIGVFREDVLSIRRRLGWEGKDKYFFLASAHDHSSPDMMGLWGPWPGVSGVDPDYREKVIHSIVELVLKLSGSLRPARIKAARDFVDPRGLCRDSRDPIVIDPELDAIEFESAVSPRRAIGTVVRWSCHATILGFDNRLATAEYPGELCARVEAETGGGCVFFNGLIGGHLIPDIERTPTVPGDYAVMKAFGDRVADAALAALRRKGEHVPAAEVRFDSRTVRVPVENSVYRLFLSSLAPGHKVFRPDGEPLTAAEIERLPWRYLFTRSWPAKRSPWVETEVSLVRIGPVKILGIPGELFPEMAIGGYDGRFRFGHPLVRPGNPDPPDLSRAPKGPYLREQLEAKYGLLVGLANDEIGYIVPAYDFKANPGLFMWPKPRGDHYEETNSIGPSATEILMRAYDDLLAPAAPHGRERPAARKSPPGRKPLPAARPG